MKLVKYFFIEKARHNPAVGISIGRRIAGVRQNGQAGRCSVHH